MDGRGLLGPLLIGLLLVAGCAGGGTDDDLDRGGTGPTCTPPDPPTVSLASNVQPIFDASCALASCHSGAAPVEDLDLSPGVARGQIVGVAARQIPSRDRVLPGDADASYLVQKIEGTPGIIGQQMPLGCPGAPQAGAVCLDGNMVAAIRTWITECALDN